MHKNNIPTIEERVAEFNEYFDKNLTPKKPNLMKGLDKALINDFLIKIDRDSAKREQQRIAQLIKDLPGFNFDGKIFPNQIYKKDVLDIVGGRKIKINPNKA